MSDFFEPVNQTHHVQKPFTIEHSAIFVGSALSFSERIISTFAGAFASFRALRVTTPADLHLFMQAHDDVEMVIFDQSFWKIVSTDCDTLRLVGGTARVALAYSDPQIALRVLRTRQAAPKLPPLGFLPMQRNLDVWLAISGLLLSGENYLPPELFDMIPPAAPEPAATEADRPLSPAAPTVISEGLAEGVKPLTDREFEVLSMVAKGKQNKTIASDLGVSEHTVKLHIHHVIRKLGVNNRTAASAWYHSQPAPDNTSLRSDNG